MKTYPLSPVLFFLTKLFSFTFLILFFSNQVSAQTFQKIYGDGPNNIYSKIIRDGSHYYAIGWSNNSPSGNEVAIVSRLDNQGTLICNIELDITSIWNDAILTNPGQLLVVGRASTADTTSNSLMGLVTTTSGGTSCNFLWLKRYSEPNLDFYNRVVKNPVAHVNFYPYYVLGTQTDLSNPPNKDVVLLQMNAAGTINSKKIIHTAGSDNFYHDLEALPNGDILLAGSSGSGASGIGLIYKMDNQGNPIGGVQISPMDFVDIAKNSTSNIIYAAANEYLTPSTTAAHIMKFDSDLLIMWDVVISQMTKVDQVWDGGAGFLYVTGTLFLNGSNRSVIVKMQDDGQAVSWVKYYNAGNINSISGALWHLPATNEMAYTDRRSLTNGFGNFDAFIAVSDLELNNCLVSSDMVSLTTANPLPDGPIFPICDSVAIPQGVNLIGFPLSWQEMEVCNNTPCCTDSLAFINTAANVQTNGTLGNCMLHFEATGLDSCMEISYNWGDSPSSDGPYGNNVPVWHTYASQGTYTVCYTITEVDTDGTICWEYVHCEEILVLCDSCCISFDDFCQNLDNEITITVDNDSCKATVNIGNIPDCDYIEYIDWGTNPATTSQGPFPPGSMAMNVYSGSGTYIISYLAVELDAAGFICFEKLVTDTITVVCDSCCISFDDFCQNLDNEITITVDNDSCKATVNIGNIPDCDYIEYIDWGTNPATTSQGPFPPGSMAMNVYSGSGTYIISYLAVELDAAGFICFEKLVTDTITVVCDSCCISFDDFCQNLDNEITITVDNDSCKATVNIGNIPDCDYIEYIDWGTNPPTTSQGPFPPGSMAMNVYSGSGTYIISYLAVELDAAGFICFEKLVTDTITVVCDSCCISFDDFCQNLDNEITITVDNDSCKATVNIGNIPDCDYIEYIDWGTNPPTTSQGPFPPGSMAMNVYSGSGTYIISYLAIELDAAGFICFEKLVTDTITVVCDSCCISFDDFCQNLDNEITITVDNDSCKATVNIGNIPDCDYIEYIDWGTNPATTSQGPFPPGSMAMNVYSGSGTYIISYLAVELDAAGFICFEKLVTDTITVVCDSCCISFDDFCQNLDNEITITVDNDSCKATVNIGNIPDCDYIEYIDWGTNPATISQGPFPPGSMAMNVYSGSGTYIISYLAIELDAAGFICFEKLVTDTITFNCLIDAVDNLTERHNITIFPNPTTGDITVQFSQPATKGTVLTIIDITGRVLVEKTVNPGTLEQTLGMFSFPEGIYFVQVVANDKIQAAGKVVKQ